MRKVSTLSIFIILLLASCSENENEVNDPETPTNNPPVIQSVSANPTTVGLNGTTTLSCVATDSENDNLICLGLQQPVVSQTGHQVLK